MSEEALTALYSQYDNGILDQILDGIGDAGLTGNDSAAHQLRLVAARDNAAAVAAIVINNIVMKVPFTWTGASLGVGALLSRREGDCRGLAEGCRLVLAALDIPSTVNGHDGLFLIPYEGLRLINYAQVPNVDGIYWCFENHYWITVPELGDIDLLFRGAQLNQSIWLHFTGSGLDAGRTWFQYGEWRTWATDGRQGYRYSTDEHQALVMNVNAGRRPDSDCTIL
ncbi:MAG TPA: hypothetical protein VHW44_02095 [Pseudonocardiaceae bacterium]|jgi:hypothetical protein|nr:hypothetical protein [Pseudonocardiaceae bacterium]